MKVKKFMNLKLLSGAGAIAICIAGCSAQRPVLYPNAQLNRVGKAAADREIAECMMAADTYVPSASDAAKTAERAGMGTVTGAVVGAAAGGAGGAVTGRAGVAAAEGAAGGGAAGAAWALIHDLFRKREPSPAYRNFVDRCLREKGYDTIGWQ